MEDKDRQLLLDFIFSFLILVLLSFLFGDILSGFRLYLTLGLICGFSFSWFVRNRKNSLSRIFMDVAVSGVALWSTASVLNSSLAYQEVILIFIKAGFLLEIILSFGSFSFSSLAYMQMLSLALFMCFPLFVKAYNHTQIILIAGYLVCWIAVLKIKLYRFAYPEKTEDLRRYYPVFLSAAFFLIIVSASWFIFSRAPLGEIKGGGILFYDSIEREDAVEKEYYSLQDALKNEMEQLIPEFSDEERNDILFMLSTLAKESPYVKEVEKAEQGLIDYLKRPGPGLEEKQTRNLTFLIRNYTDKKILVNLERIKGRIKDALSRSRLTIKTKTSILNRLNKMQHSNSYPEVANYASQLKETVERSALNAEVKNELKMLLQEGQDWKAFAIYRQSRDALLKKIDSSGGELRKGLEDVVTSVDTAEGLSALEDAGNKAADLQKAGLPRSGELAHDIEELSELKLNLFILEEMRKIREKLDKSGLSENRIQQLKKGLSALGETDDSRQFADVFSPFRENAMDEGLNVSENLGRLLEMKTLIFLKKHNSRIKDTLGKESTLADSGKDFMKELEQMEKDTDTEKAVSDAQRLNEGVKKFLSQGIIAQETKENLVKDLEEVKDALIYKLKEKEQLQGKTSPRESFTYDYQKGWKELLKGAALREERKDSLQELMKELSAAQTISQIDDLKDMLRKETQASSKEGAGKEGLKELSEEFEKAAQVKKRFIIEKSLAKLRGEINDLKGISREEAEKLRDYLERISASPTNESLKNEINALKEYLDSHPTEAGDVMSKAGNGDLIKEIEETRNLLIPRLQGEGSAKEQKEEDLRAARIDYRKAMENIIDQSSLAKQRKDKLKEDINELLRAGSILKVRETSESLENEIQKLAVGEMEGRQKEKLQDAFKKLAGSQMISAVEKEFADIREEIGQIKEPGAARTERVKDYLERIRNSSTKEALKNIDTLKRYLEEDREQSRKPQAGEQTNKGFDIYILPARNIVIPLGSSVSLKCIAVYSGKFIKELNSDLDWFSENPNVAWVDDKGLLQTLSKGKTRLTARYKGRQSTEALVTVIDRVPEQTGRAIKQELLR